MSGFARVNGELALDGVGLTAIAARFGTPLTRANPLMAPPARV